MTGAIIVVTFSFYILTFIVGLGLPFFGPSLAWLVLIVPPIVAGLFGGMQFARTEKRGLRIINRLALAFKSCLAIVFAPLLISFVLMLAFAVTGGLSTLTMVPGMASFMTLAGLIQLAIFVLYGLPAIFIGLTAGQWMQYKLMTR